MVIQVGNNIRHNMPAHAQISELQESFKRDANLYLPMANIIKIMRRMLPENAKIADDAKETIQECVSEFIDHITREANTICHHDHRKTITPEDVLFAMETTKFHNYAATLSQFLRKYREEDPARNFMRGRPLVWPNVVESVQAQEQVAQLEVNNGLVDPVHDFYSPSLGEGSSSGPMNASFDFPLEEFDVYQPFKWKSAKSVIYLVSELNFEGGK